MITKKSISKKDVIIESDEDDIDKRLLNFKSSKKNTNNNINSKKQEKVKLIPLPPILNPNRCQCDLTDENQSEDDKEEEKGSNEELNDEEIKKREFFDTAYPTEYDPQKGPPELFSFRENQWLSSLEVLRAIKYVIGTSSGIYLPEPEYAISLQYNTFTFSTSLKRLTKLFNQPQIVSGLMYLFLVNQNHFALLYIYRDIYEFGSGKIEWYDSFGGGPSKVNEKIIKNEILYPLYKLGYDEEEFAYSNLKYLKNVKQNSETECGVFAVWFAQQIVFGKSIEEIDKDQEIVSKDDNQCKLLRSKFWKIV